MTIKIIGTIKPKTIYQVLFSCNGVEKRCCTSTNTHKKDAEKFADQFKKIKNPVVTMELLTEHGKEYEQN